MTVRSEAKAILTVAACALAIVSAAACSKVEGTPEQRSTIAASPAGGGAESASVEETSPTAGERLRFGESLGLKRYVPYTEISTRLAPRRAIGVGFVVERQVVALDLGVRLPVLVYRPSRTAGARPAVIALHGDDVAGMVAPDLQRACQALALSGFLVVAYDRDGFGERAGTWTPSGSDPFASAGTTLAAHRVWEAVRVVDYLSHRPDVERRRIGVMGQNAGADVGVVLAAANPRIAAVSVRWPDSSPDITILPAGFDFGGVLARLVHPRPLRFLAPSGRSDYRDAAKQARAAYCPADLSCPELDTEGATVAGPAAGLAWGAEVDWMLEKVAWEKTAFDPNKIVPFPAAELSCFKPGEQSAPLTDVAAELASRTTPAGVVDVEK
jgi:hypothetical protein